MPSWAQIDRPSDWLARPAKILSSPKGSVCFDDVEAWQATSVLSMADVPNRPRECRMNQRSPESSRPDALRLSASGLAPREQPKHDAAGRPRLRITLIQR